MQYKYNVGEVYLCNECGLRVKITITAAPVQEVMCCGQEMEFDPTDDGENDEIVDESAEYKVDDEYYCPVCGIECKILSSGEPSQPLMCCGVPLEIK